MYETNVPLVFLFYPTAGITFSLDFFDFASPRISFLPSQIIFSLGGLFAEAHANKIVQLPPFPSLRLKHQKQGDKKKLQHRGFENLDAGN